MGRRLEAANRTSSARPGELRRCPVRQPTVRSDTAIVSHTLMRAGNAMDCVLVYALVPRSSLQHMVATQARHKAGEHLSRVIQHSRLEDQQPDDDDIAAQIEDLADDFADRRGLWAATKQR